MQVGTANGRSDWQALALALRLPGESVEDRPRFAGRYALCGVGFVEYVAPDGATMHRDRSPGTVGRSSGRSRTVHAHQAAPHSPQPKLPSWRTQFPKLGVPHDGQFSGMIFFPVTAPALGAASAAGASSVLSADSGSGSGAGSGEPDSAAASAAGVSGGAASGAAASGTGASGAGAGVAAAAGGSTGSGAAGLGAGADAGGAGAAAGGAGAAVRGGGGALAGVLSPRPRRRLAKPLTRDRIPMSTPLPARPRDSQPLHSAGEQP